MKRIQLLSASLATIFLAGCTQMFDYPHGNYDYDYYDKYGHHYDPNATAEPMTNMSMKGKPHGHKPRPYSVTPEDQSKYDTLSNSIKRNQQKAKGNVTVKTTSETKAEESKPDAAKSDSKEKKDEAKSTSTSSTETSKKTS